MAVGDRKATDLVKVHGSEAVKQYITYDGSNRMEFVYTATAEAGHGDRCGVTQYAYDAASTRVVKMKESLGVWDSSWDV